MGDIIVETTKEMALIDLEVLWDKIEKDKLLYNLQYKELLSFIENCTCDRQHEIDEYEGFELWCVEHKRTGECVRELREEIKKENVINLKFAPHDHYTVIWFQNLNNYKRIEELKIKYDTE